MNCPTCQAALPEDTVFCGHCGGALRSEQTCVRCGRSNTPEMRFCLGCGAALSSASPRAGAPHVHTEADHSGGALLGARQSERRLCRLQATHPHTRFPKRACLSRVVRVVGAARGWSFFGRLGLEFFRLRSLVDACEAIYNNGRPEARWSLTNFSGEPRVWD